MIASPRDISGPLTRQSILIAAVCLAVDAAAFAVTAGPLGVSDWVVLAAIVGVDAALALPARYSLAVALAHAAVRAGTVALLGLSPRSEVLTRCGLLVAGYRAGAWLRGGAASVALIGLIAGVIGGHLIVGGYEWWRAPIDAVKVALLPWLVGRYTTARRGYLAELERHAENELREAKAAVAQAAADERGAIARDLHDGISHYVSAIGVHAGAARLELAAAGNGTVGVPPPRRGLAGSLAAVEAASRAAMADLRRLLDLLHSDRFQSTRQPGLDNLDELLRTVSAAGMATRLHTHGHVKQLPESLDVAAYRIAQEMLTNALRHGDGTEVDLSLNYRDTGLAVTATNPLPATPARPNDQPGRGLAGIRERAALFGGEVSYGTDPGARTWTTAVTFSDTGRCP